MNGKPPLRTYQRKNKAATCIVHHPSQYHRNLWGGTFNGVLTTTNDGRVKAEVALDDTLPDHDYFETTFDRIAKGVTSNPSQSRGHQILENCSNTSSDVSSLGSPSHKEVSRHLNPINSDLATIKPRTPRSKRTSARRKNGIDSEMVVVTKRMKNNGKSITTRKGQTMKITQRRKQPPRGRKQLSKENNGQAARKKKKNLNKSDSDLVEENSNDYLGTNLCVADTSRTENVNGYRYSGRSSLSYDSSSVTTVKCSTPICSRLVKIRESMSCFSPITAVTGITDQGEWLGECPRKENSTENSLESYKDGTKQETVKLEAVKILTAAPEKTMNLPFQDYNFMSPLAISSIQTDIDQMSLDSSLMKKISPNRKHATDERKYSDYPITSPSVNLSESDMFSSASGLSSRKDIPKLCQSWGVSLQEAVVEQQTVVSRLNFGQATVRLEKLPKLPVEFCDTAVKNSSIPPLTPDNSICSAVTDILETKNRNSSSLLSSDILSMPPSHDNDHEVILENTDKEEVGSSGLTDGDVLTVEKLTKGSLQPPLANYVSTGNFESDNKKKSGHFSPDNSGSIFDTREQSKKDVELSGLDDASSVNILQEVPVPITCFVTMTRGTKRAMENFVSDSWSSQLLDSSARHFQHLSNNVQMIEHQVEKQDADSIAHMGILTSEHENSDCDISHGMGELELQETLPQHDLKYKTECSSLLNVRKGKEYNSITAENLSVTDNHNSVMSSITNSTGNNIFSATCPADEDNCLMRSQVQFIDSYVTDLHIVEFCNSTSGSSISGVQDTSEKPENISIAQSGLQTVTEKLQVSKHMSKAGHCSDKNTISDENQSSFSKERSTLWEYIVSESALSSRIHESEAASPQNNRQQSWNTTGSSLVGSNLDLERASGKHSLIVPENSPDSSNDVSDQKVRVLSPMSSISENRDLPLEAEHPAVIFGKTTAVLDSDILWENQTKEIVRRKTPSCTKSRVESDCERSCSSGSFPVAHVRDCESRSEALLEISDKINTTNPDKIEKYDDTTMNMSEVSQTFAVFLKPGKDWARSLSILNNIQNGCNIEPLCAGKGKKWRQSVQTILNMQQQGVIQSCVKENEDEDKDVHSSYGANDSTVERLLPKSQGWNIASCTASPNRFIRRMSIRVVPNNRSFGDKEDTFFLGAYGFTVNKNRTTFSKTSTALIPNERTQVYNVQCKDVGVEAVEEGLVVTAREAVLQKCSQEDYLSFSHCFSKTYSECCRKIGEGVYGEVFLYENEQEKSVIKIIPIEGDQLVNGEPQKRFDEILSEIVIAKELHCMRFGNMHKTSGFAQVKNVKCIIGKYPDTLVELWKNYDNEKGSDNDCPEIFLENQLYIALELGHGGQDLEAFVFHTAVQSHALFIQTALALAVAERSLEFEHRDLHWGNILISETKDSRIYYKLDGKEVYCPSKGVQVAIIDFTLSRMSYEGCCIYNDLALDPALFTAQGEYQFEIYRLMRDRIGNNWQKFEPYTNILWLHYTLDKMITAVRYRRKTTKAHKNGILLLQELKEVILDYNSVHDFVTKCDKVTTILQTINDCTTLTTAVSSPQF